VVDLVPSTHAESDRSAPERDNPVRLQTKMSTMTSAFIGDLPANGDDLAIIKGVLRLYGLNNVNASAGYQYAIKRPADPPVESKQAGIVVGMAIVILAILVPTIARIWIRLGKRSQEFGLDDWTIMVAAVSGPFPSQEYRSHS